MEMRGTRPLEKKEQIGRLMKCLISSVPVSQAGQVAHMSAHLQMLYAEHTILYHGLSKALRQTTGPFRQILNMSTLGVN